MTNHISGLSVTRPNENQLLENDTVLCYDNEFKKYIAYLLLFFTMPFLHTPFFSALQYFTSLSKITTPNGKYLALIYFSSEPSHNGIWYFLECKIMIMQGTGYTNLCSHIHSMHENNIYRRL